MRIQRSVKSIRQGRRPGGARSSAVSYKVGVGKRVGAALIDLVIGITIGLFFIISGAPAIGLFLVAAYLLIRDGLPIKQLKYQSIGKRLVQLHVESVQSGKKRLDPLTSILRNAPLAAGPILAALVSFVSVPAGLAIGAIPLLIELVVVATDANGLRFGDKLAGTKVLD